MKKKAFLLCAAAAVTLTASVSVCALPVMAQTEPAPAAAVQTLGEDQVTVVPMDYSYDYDHDYDYDSGYHYADTTTAKKKSPDWLKIILISLGISLVVTGITVFFIYNGYKNNGKTEPYEYTKKAPLELTDKADELVDVRVTTRTIHRD